MASNLPSQASVDLPGIFIHGDHRTQTGSVSKESMVDSGMAEQLTLREGNYLNAVAEVEPFQHSLTTDLLNHLVFVQKVFMKVG